MKVKRNKIVIAAAALALAAGGAGGAYAAFAGEDGKTPAESEVRCLAIGPMCEDVAVGDPDGLIAPDAEAPTSPDPLATYPVGQAPDNPDPAA